MDPKQFEGYSMVNKTTPKQEDDPFNSMVAGKKDKMK